MSELPPIKIGDHPCAPAMIWGELEIAWITEYAKAAVLAEREACAKLCELHAVESQVIIAMTIDMSQHEVASLCCAALSAPAGWQPIETMPRTGKMVLLWSRNAGFFAGNRPPGCAAGEWLKISGDWRGSSHWRAQEATHWMPLPAAPSPKEQT